MAGDTPYMANPDYSIIFKANDNDEKQAQQLADAGKNANDQMKQQRVNDLMRQYTDPNTGQVDSGPFVAAVMQIDPQLANKYNDYFTQMSERKAKFQTDMANSQQTLAYNKLVYQNMQHEQDIKDGKEVTQYLANVTDPQRIPGVLDMIAKKGVDVSQWRSLPLTQETLQNLKDSALSVVQNAETEYKKNLLTLNTQKADNQLQLGQQRNDDQLQLGQQRIDNQMQLGQQNNDIKIAGQEQKQNQFEAKQQASSQSASIKQQQDQSKFALQSQKQTTDLDNDARDVKDKAYSQGQNFIKIRDLVNNILKDSTLEKYFNNNVTVQQMMSKSSQYPGIIDLWNRIQQLDAIKFIELAQSMKGLGALSDKDADNIKYGFGRIENGMSLDRIAEILGQILQYSNNGLQHVQEDYTNFYKWYVQQINNIKGNVQNFNTAGAGVNQSDRNNSNSAIAQQSQSSNNSNIQPATISNVGSNGAYLQTQGQPQNQNQINTNTIAGQLQSQ